MTLMLFPTDPDAVVLSRSSGIAGSYVIWKMKTCQFHFHWSYSVCGIREDDRLFPYPHPGLMEDEALQMCIAYISEDISRQTKDWVNGQLRN